MKSSFTGCLLVLATCAAGCGVFDDVSATKAEVKKTNANMEKMLGLVEQSNQTTATVRDDSAAMRKHIETMDQNTADMLQNIRNMGTDTHVLAEQLPKSMTSLGEQMGGKIGSLQTTLIDPKGLLGQMNGTMGTFKNYAEMGALSGALDDTNRNLTSNMEKIENLGKSSRYRIRTANGTYRVIMQFIKLRPMMVKGMVEKNKVEGQTLKKAKEAAEKEFDETAEGLLASYIIGALELPATTENVQGTISHHLVSFDEKDGKKNKWEKWSDKTLADFASLDPGDWTKFLKIGEPVTFPVPYMRQKFEIGLPPLSINLVMALGLYGPTGVFIVNELGKRLYSDDGNLEHDKTEEFLSFAEEANITMLDDLSKANLRGAKITPADLVHFQKRMEIVALIHSCIKKRNPYYTSLLRLAVTQLNNGLAPVNKLSAPSQKVYAEATSFFRTANVEYSDSTAVR